MFRPTVLLLATLLISTQSVLAHFNLTYPASRGFVEATEPTVPCGGFNNVQTRTQMPLTNAFLEINSEHTSYTYTVSVIVNSNPTTADFSTSNLVQVASGSRNYPEQACLSLDLGKNANITAGSNATIQVVFNGGDGELYQCTDVTFATSAPNFNNSICVNADGSSTSNTTSSAATQSSSASSITAATGLMMVIASGLSFVFA